MIANSNYMSVQIMKENRVIVNHRMKDASDQCNYEMPTPSPPHSKERFASSLGHCEEVTLPTSPGSR